MTTTAIRRLLPVLLFTTLLTSCGYNQLVGLQQNIQASWAQVQNQLQRRNDLIPNLVETVKGYATHESSVFTEVANARSRLINAGSRDEQIDAAQNLSGALGRLLAIAEQYPQLKANEQFNRLSDELAGPRTASRSSACASTTPCGRTKRCATASRRSSMPTGSASRRRSTSTPRPRPSRCPR